MSNPGAPRPKKATRTAVTVDGETVELRRPHKYGAEPVTVNGERYDSRLEADYAADLALRKAAGQIADWRRGERITLLGPVSILGGRAQAVTWRPDFLVVPVRDRSYYVDTKGVETPMWRMKMRLLKRIFPATRVLVVDRTGRERWV